MFKDYSLKSIDRIAIEASVVGVSLIVLVYVAKMFKDNIPNLTGYKMDIEFYFIIGFIFHVIFEYTGLNLWYSKDYCKMI